MLKILHVGPSLSLQGGIVTVIKTIINEKRYFFKNGYELYSFESTPLRGLAGFASYFLQPFLFALSAYSKDIIHFHLASNGSFYRKIIFYIVSKLLRKRTVIHLHGGGFFDFFDRARPTVKKLITFLFTTCTSIIVVSDFSARQLKSRINIKAPIILAPNSSLEFENIPTGNFQPGLHNQILFCGTLVPYKGLDDLLQAMTIIKEKIADVKLVVAGNGEQSPWLQRADELGVKDSVDFCGFVEGENKIRLYMDATIFCLPSHFESFGIAALEAMHCGKAVVSTTAGGLPDLVTHGENGLLSAPGDFRKLAENIVILLSDRNLSDNYGSNGKMKARQRFTSSQSLNNLVLAYEACT